MSITPLSTPPSRSDPANFRARTDTFLAELPTFAAQANATEANINAKESLATAAGVLAQAALDAGLADAASNAALAASARAAAESAWTAALAANPDLDPVVRMNPSTVSSNTTIPSYYNAYSAGPLTVGEGVDITLNDNANWSVL